MKIFIVVATLFLLIACGGGGGGGSGDEEAIPDFETITISSVGSTQIISSAETVDIIIDGTNNIIRINEGTSVNDLVVSGVSNEITIEDNVLVNTIEMTGTFNTIIIPTGSDFIIVDSGVDNEIIEATAP